MKSRNSKEEHAFNKENACLCSTKHCVLTMKIKPLFHGCRSLFNIYSRQYKLRCLLLIVLGKKLND